jgi:hypothetical protein
MTWSNPGAILLAMHFDAAGESLRLAEEYRVKSDDELRELAADFGDLTEPAQQALRNEMHSRKLGDPQATRVPNFDDRARTQSTNEPAQGPGNAPGRSAPGRVVPSVDEPEIFPTASAFDVLGHSPKVVSDEPDDGDEDIASGPHDYTWKTVLCACDEYKEAWRISEALRRAGIASWIERQGSKNAIPWVGEFMTGELQVQVAADELDSARAVASQPIPHDIIEDSETETPEFVLPKCPKCGAEDPVLESADPQNTWRCEQCDATWSDPMEASDESPAKRAEPAS